MKGIFTFSIFIFFYIGSYSQDLVLVNDALYNNNQVVAFLKKEVNAGNPFADIKLYNLQKKNIINAVVKKLKAPVRELKSFFYYDIIFPELNDSFSLYYDKEAFSIHFAEIINRYHLIENGQLNLNGVANFKKQYSQQALSEKIDAIRTYLNDTRNYNHQVERDRTKPVYIINERSIIQDSVVIGYFNITDVPVNLDKVATQNPIQRVDFMINPEQKVEIRMTDGTVVENRYLQEYFSTMRKNDLGYELFINSKPPKLSMANRYVVLLGLACCLVENYAL